jgi:serine/threonine protein kinase
VQAKGFSRTDIENRIAKLRERDRRESEDDEKVDTTDGGDDISPLLNQTEKVKMEDFELLKVLGRGSFGKVMQVKKKSDGKVYAMKILKKRAIIARNQVEHTKAERKILQALQHPFLMTLRYAFQSKEKLYFVLDYYQGGELFFHLKNNRRFPEDVARIYVGEIALALGHLHSLNVIYRDLKPENILLDDNGHVCLTDFGLSKDVNPEEKAHTFCGTPEYLAPEIVTGAGHDKAVDWWSLGILLYELTVGIPPFYSQNVNEMYNKIQHGVLRFPPFLSDNCKSLIVALLNRDPKKRCGSKDDVDDIKTHPFFKDISFEKMMKKQIDVPYKPKVKQTGEGTDNFAPEFTNEPVVDSMVASSALSQTLSSEADAFNNFTFKQTSALV